MNRLAVFAVLLCAGSAHAFCELPGSPLRWVGSSVTRHDIPVYLYAPSGTFNGLPATQVEQEIKLAINLWLEQSTAWFRPYYAGRTTDTNTDNRIVVREGTDSDCPGFPGCTDTTIQHSLFSWGTQVGATVMVNPVDKGGFNTLAGINTTITHELGHGFGLGDLYLKSCDNGIHDHTGVMGGAWDIHHSGGSLGPSDQFDMVELYGPTSNSWVYQESTDGVSWVAGSTQDSVVSSLALGGGSTGLTTERFLLPGTPGRVESTCTQANCGSSITALPGTSAPTTLPGAIAVRSSKEWLIAWQEDGTPIDGQHLLWYSVTSNAGATYAHYPVFVPGSFVSTPMVGVGATWDQDSDHYVVVTRLPTGNFQSNLVFVTVPPSAPANLVVTTLPIDAWRSPSLACRSNHYSDCVVAYLGPGAMHPVTWQHVYVDTNLRVVRNGPEYVAAPSGAASPSVILSGLSRPFALAWVQDNLATVGLITVGDNDTLVQSTAASVTGGTMISPTLTRITPVPPIILQNALIGIHPGQAPDELHLRLAVPAN